MKRQVPRVWGVLVCGVALSCGRSNAFVGHERGPTAGQGPAGASAGGSAGAGAGGRSSGGEAGKGGSTPAGGSSGAGGAGQGGTAGAGQGGTAGSAEPPPLRACILNRESTARADFCELSMQCPASTFVTTTCTLSGDTWWCECQGTTGPQRHEVSGLGSPEVCEEVATLCASRKKPSGPGECTWTVETREPTSCRLERGCVRNLENADGVDATITSHDDATCYDDGSGGLTCICNPVRGFQVTGQTGSEACDTVIEICSGNSSPAPSEPMCSLRLDSDDGVHCRVDPICAQSADLGGGVTVVEFEGGEFNCNDNLGRAYCNCFTNFFQAGHFILESPTEAGACERFVPLCGQVAPTALSTEIECVPIEQFVNDESCNVGLTCAQSAEFDGERLDVLGTLTADCVRVGDRFVCNCIAYDDSAQIDVQAATAWDACTAAATECQAAVTVTIGDGVILPPVPPP